MAIYHLHMQVISRSDGRSAVAAAAYRSASRLVDATGKIYDFRRKRGVLEHKIFVPEGCPAIDREMLWLRAEAAEKRKNSCLAREMDVALPTECTPDENRKILTEFTVWLSNRWRVPVDVNVHFQTRKNLPTNNHAHLQFATRVYEKDGSFAEKTRDWDNVKLRHDCLDEVRKMWTEVCNKHLKKYGTYIDHRSLKNQNIDRLPQIHVGTSATAMERRGIQTERGNLNREILAINAETAQLNEEINNGTPMDIGSIGACTPRNENSAARNRGISAQSREGGGGQRLEQRSSSAGYGASGVVDGQICNNEHEYGGNTPLHVYSAVGATLGNIGTRSREAENRCANAQKVIVPVAVPTAKQKRVTDMKDKVRNILYTSDDVCRAAWAAVDARNAQVLQKRNFSVFKMHCRESMYLCDDITREALGAVDRRNDQYMAHWLSASKKRHAARQKMAIFKNTVGNILEVTYHLNKAAFAATDYNDSAFLYEVLNPPEAFVEVPQDDGDDSPQNDMEM